MNNEVQLELLSHIETEIMAFSKKLEKKFGHRFEMICLDNPGSFAITIADRLSYTSVEKEEHLKQAEIYVRAWFNIKGSIAIPSFSIYTLPITIEYIDEEFERPVQVEGKIVDVEYEFFNKDPLVVVKLSNKKEYSIIECYCSQIVSFWPKDLRSSFSLVDATT